jgi:hypothetical protein
MGIYLSMSSFQKYRLWIAGIIVVVIGITLLVLGYQALAPLPDNTDFKNRYFSFSYPRSYNVTEYAPGVASIGSTTPVGFDPLVEIVRYQSDPDVALPVNFDAFMKRQAAALCGADGPVESISCTEVGVTPYISLTGIEGQALNLTMIHKNLRSGTTSSSIYGPVYVFNTSETRTATTTPDNPYRYSALFVYPSLPTYLTKGTTTPQLLKQILDTLTVES